MSVIEVRDLRRHFGEVKAVDGVSLRVEAGEIFGLLGPNGSGKTTLLNCLQGLDRPDSGEMEVLGLHPLRDRQQLTRRFGTQLQSASLIPRLKVSETLRLFAALYEHTLDPDELLAQLGLTSKGSARLEKLSGGQRQRVFIALALLHDPELLFFDELTSAVDPQARLAIWDILRDLHKQGRTIMLTTHSMAEAEELCDRIAIIDAGRIVATGSPSALIAEHAGDATLRLSVEGEVPLEAIGSLDGVSRAWLDGHRLVVTGSEDFAPRVLARLAPAGITVTDMKLDSPDLEDVFLALTGRRMREGE